MFEDDLLFEFRFSVGREMGQGTLSAAKIGWTPPVKMWEFTNTKWDTNKLLIRKTEPL